jgi:hypothetical protein
VGLLDATGLAIEFPAVEPEIAPVADEFPAIVSRIEEPVVPAIEAKVSAVLDDIAAVMADLIAVLTNVSVVVEGCLSLGSNGGEE